MPIDKLRPKRASSTLHWSERVMLAMRSYAELTLDFGIVYSLLPRCAWVENRTTTPPDRITDMIWYRANVITTSGGGGFLPESPWAKMLSAAEVLCGVTLLVVSFTVYLSRALGGKPTTLR
ncbi:ion channel [Sphingomonas sp. Leaf205]|uniref:ion channel n=1 Tax=Sphingomonas sp. Leaf205 TaxID=2876551 RepID=UPI001E64F0AA|nr:ion channel [Sphingomonas sp. Leaf205]